MGRKVKLIDGKEALTDSQMDSFDDVQCEEYYWNDAEQYELDQLTGDFENDVYFN